MEASGEEAEAVARVTVAGTRGARAARIAPSMSSATLGLMVPALMLLAPSTGHGGSDRTTRITLECVVDGAPEEVFALWTSENGVRQFFCPMAHIEPRVGGRYEMIFSPDQDPDGSSYGTRGARILRLVPNRELNFEWPSFLAWADPAIPGGPPVSPELRDERPIPWVEVTFLAADRQRTMTRVQLVHHGFREGAPWLASRRYFWTAWSSVMGRLGALCSEIAERKRSP